MYEVMNKSCLKGFEELAIFSMWDLDTPDARQAQRQSSSPEQLQMLYDGITPHLEAIMEELDRFPLGELPETRRFLLNLAFSMAEVAPHVELYRCDPKVPYAFEEKRLIAIHGGQSTWHGNPPRSRER
ncbi:hypothetical protein ACMAUO_17100 [Gluconacetobacter sp. Hr-1-5]|uniref:hypothetical protein n=1 Tax=Gluconacetobacter sp. Hr-1-5 TaxID=3395370 RepID=UPI003B52F0C0